MYVYIFMEFWKLIVRGEGERESAHGCLKNREAFGAGRLKEEGRSGGKDDHAATKRRDKKDGQGTANRCDSDLE